MVYSTESAKDLMNMQNQTGDTTSNKLSCGLETVVHRGQSITAGNRKSTLHNPLKNQLR